MKKKRQPLKFILNTTFLILIGIAGYAVYDLVTMGVSDILTNVGIENPYYQGLILLATIFTIVIISGKSLKKTIQDIAC